MDQSLIGPAAAEESLLAGPARDVAPAGTRRQILMVSPASGQEPAFEASIRRWGLELSAGPGVCRVSLDRIQRAWAGGPSRFPAEALLSLWLSTDSTTLPADLPAGLTLTANVLTAVCETPPEVLRELYQPA